MMNCSYFCDGFGSFKCCHVEVSRMTMKAQPHILPNEIHSININPSCPYQLGFHLDDGLYVRLKKALLRVPLKDLLFTFKGSELLLSDLLEQ
nr:putative WD40/YVTN repeat-like-containing domain-containing protein [Tanacetum cinerariifolium]